MKPRRLTAGFLMFCVLLVCSSFFGCAHERNYQKEIDSIYVSHSSFGTVYPEYKIS